MAVKMTKADAEDAAAAAQIAQAATKNRTKAY